MATPSDKTPIGPVYVDSSVILRVLLRQDNQLAEWMRLENMVSSELVEVEVPRVIDRLAIQGVLADDEAPVYTAAALQLIRGLDRLELDRAVLMQAAQPMRVAMRTLDAIHLATALRWQRENSPDAEKLYFATHDIDLAAGAVAHGFAFDTILGVSTQDIQKRLAQGRASK